MDIGHTVAVKAFIFGGTLPIATLLVSKAAPEWLAWGVGAMVWTALFHWLPPRIHHGLTPARSALLCLAAGVLAAIITAQALDVDVKQLTGSFALVARTVVAARRVV